MTEERHPDYDRWVKAWGKRAADEENRVWLDKRRRTEGPRYTFPERK